MVDFRSFWEAFWEAFGSRGAAGGRDPKGYTFWTPTGVAFGTLGRPLGRFGGPLGRLWATFGLHFGVPGVTFHDFFPPRFFIDLGMDFGWVLASILGHFWTPRRDVWRSTRTSKFDDPYEGLACFSLSKNLDFPFFFHLFSAVYLRALCRAVYSTRKMKI